MPTPSPSLFPSPNLYPGTTGLVGTGPFLFLGGLIQRHMPIMPGLAALINFSTAVFRINGQWVESEYPSEQQLNAADLYFQGGVENIITDPDVAASLQDAGYTVTDLSAPTS